MSRCISLTFFMLCLYFVVAILVGHLIRASVILFPHKKEDITFCSSGFKV